MEENQKKNKIRLVDLFATACGNYVTIAAG